MAAALILAGYGIFLAFTGWAGSPPAHALYAGLAGGSLLVACGLGALGSPRKGDPGYVRWMIAVHVGLLLTALFLAVFSAQFLRAKTQRQRRIFAVMAVGSLAALFLLIKAKPKKTKP